MSVLKFNPNLTSASLPTTSDFHGLPAISMPLAPAVKTQTKTKIVPIEYVFLAMPFITGYNYIRCSNERNISNVTRSAGQVRGVNFALRRIINPVKDTMILSEDKYGSPDWIMIRTEMANSVLMMKPQHVNKWSNGEPTIIRMNDNNKPHPEHMALVQKMSNGHTNTCPILCDMLERDERLKSFYIMSVVLAKLNNRNEYSSDEGFLNADETGSEDN
jgi:hypothetical protein